MKTKNPKKKEEIKKKNGKREKLKFSKIYGLKVIKRTIRELNKKILPKSSASINVKGGLQSWVMLDP